MFNKIKNINNIGTKLILFLFSYSKIISNISKNYLQCLGGILNTIYNSTDE